VVKRLPELLNGNRSKIKLITAANKIKSPKFLPLRNLKFLKIKTTNNNASIDVKKSPTIPVSVNISR
tara:strand:+ start:499 stop:699 length:201 start_codon:yes stop_codon:yes gene_type:complete